MTFARRAPPRLVGRANVDGYRVHDLQREFDKVDLNGNGTVSRSELREMLFVHGLDDERANEECVRLFTSMGHLDENEEMTFCDFYNSYMREQRSRALSRLKVLATELFAEADTNRDGLLSYEDVLRNYAPLLGSHVTRESVLTLFQDINLSGSGMVTLKELFNYY